MKIVKEFILRKIAGESILVPTGKTSQEINGMITLSETAAFIWENLEKVNSLDELVDQITEEFEVERDIALSDAGQLISELCAAGFVVPTKEDHTW